MSLEGEGVESNLNQLKIRSDKIFEEIQSKLKEYYQCIQMAEQLRQKAIRINADLGNKEMNVSNKEKEWKDVEVILPTTTSSEDKVILDVGGERFLTTIQTLTRIQDTSFTQLFSHQWKLQRDSDDKTIFVDGNGKLFHYILAYLRTDKVPNDTLINESLCQHLIIEAEYYQLHNLTILLTDCYFSKGTLLKREQKLKVNEFYGKTNQQWELIYKASHDGFDAKSFHTKCDDQGPTLTIIQSNNNYLFGGYTSIPWTSENGSYKNDPTAFLFTLTNPHHIPPTKYFIKPTTTEYAVRHHSSYGPIFGGGHDMFATNNSNITNSTINFSYSYIDTTGKGSATFTGANSYTVSDIEVFRLS